MPRIDQAIHLGEFVEQSRSQLKPPVSNRLLFSGEHLKVMIVGGPNERDDFHVESGEELFYQISGSMDLDVMQGGKRTRLPIGQGDLFVLPALVPHSPQRYANTIGLVIERARSPDELDELRWYWPATNSLLYHERFHCTDLGSQIKAVIERFMATDLAKALRDPVDSELPPPMPAEPVIHTPPPSALADLISASSAAAPLVDSEFVVEVYKGHAAANSPVPLRHVPGQEVFLMQLSGASVVSGNSGSEPIALGAEHVCLLSGGVATSGEARQVTLSGADSAMLAVYTKRVLGHGHPGDL